MVPVFGKLSLMASVAIEHNKNSLFKSISYTEISELMSYYPQSQVIPDSPNAILAGANMWTVSGKMFVRDSSKSAAPHLSTIDPLQMGDL